MTLSSNQEKGLPKSVSWLISIDYTQNASMRTIDRRNLTKIAIFFILHLFDHFSYIQKEWKKMYYNLLPF